MVPVIRQAIIPAAGWGTRFLPATKAFPKELATVVDKPSIQYIVEEGMVAGIEEFVFVISHGKESILEHFAENAELEAILREKGRTKALASITQFKGRARFRAVYQEQALGLGHAVLMAATTITDDWFFVFLPDDIIDNEVPCALQMRHEFEQQQQAMVAVMPVPWERVHEYGVVRAEPITTHIGKVSQFIEKPKREAAPSNLAIVGRYLLPKKLFSLLEKSKPGAIGEIQLTDALQGLIDSPGIVAFKFEGDRYDVGNPLGFLEANIQLALKHPDLQEDVNQLIHLLAESR